MTDWKQIKEEYTAGGVTYRELAEKHGVPLHALAQNGLNENWVGIRRQRKKGEDEEREAEELRENVCSEAKEDAPEGAASAGSEEVVACSDRSAEILDAADKLLFRLTLLAEAATAAQSIKQLSSALKDIKEITGYKTELDRREQTARIQKLERESRRDEDMLTGIEVFLQAGPEDWNE